MNRFLTFACASLLCSSVLAAPPKFNIRDNSPEILITSAAANTVWTTHLPEKLAKLYPIKKWGYVSEVNGGFDAKTCAVVARVMMVPVKGKTFIYEPKKTSVTLGTQVGATAGQCSELAKAKLTEAVQSLVSSLEGN